MMYDFYLNVVDLMYGARLLFQKQMDEAHCRVNRIGSAGVAVW
jgi:hypothetical protein